MEIDPINDVIVRRAIGKISIDDIIQANDEIWKHPNFHTGMDAIWDLRDAEVGHLSTEDLRKVSRFLSTQIAWRGAHYRLALVTSNEIDYIVSSTFAIIGQIENVPINVQVFRDYDKAVAWGFSDPDQSIGAAHCHGR